MKINTQISTHSSFSSSNIGQCIWLLLLWMGMTILIFDRFLRNITRGRIMERRRICIHKISEAYRLLAIGKSFITELLKGPSQYAHCIFFLVGLACYEDLSLQRPFKTLFSQISMISRSPLQKPIKCLCNRCILLFIYESEVFFYMITVFCK